MNRCYRWIKLTLLGVLCLVALLLAGDLIYAGMTSWRYAAWERDISRNGDGVRTGCETFSTGEGTIGLLLIHGFGDSPRVYRQLAEDLAGMGLRCETVRFPGFAEPMAVYKNSKLDDWTRVVVEGVQKMKAEGCQQVVVVGHSMGAAVCLTLAQNNRLPVDGLVLMAPLLKVSSQRSPLLTPEQWFTVSSYVLPFSSMVENVFGLELVSAQPPQDDGRDRFIPRGIYRELFGLCHQVQDGSRTLSMPVMLITAEADQVIDNPSAIAFVESLDVPKKRMLHLEHSAHAIPLDGERSLVAEAIWNFTSECLR